MKKRLTIYLILLLTGAMQASFATDYYLATTGNDSNNGTLASTPFKTLTKAVSLAKTGDVIFVASGTYSTTATVTVTASGITIKGMFTSAATRPIFDFSSMSVGSANFGIHLKGSNCSFFGIIIKGAGDNGFQIDGGSYNSIEFCDFLENQDSGVQIKGGAAHNKFINCDSYYNVDPAQGNADGFADKLDEGGFNSFRACRAYQNSDDGWDGLLGDVNSSPSDTIYDSWCYKNGYLKDGSKSQGNGNGFKLGGTQGSATTGPFKHRQTIIRCLSVLNLTKGFDYNNNVGSMTLYNCTGFGNGGIGNFAFPNAVASGEVLVLKNCLSYDTKYGQIYASATQATNSWSGGFTVTSADFLSTDDTQMLLPRKADGSLPDITFMHLAKGSDLIDAGTSVGLPFIGSKPDLGCFETSAVVTGFEDESISSSNAVLYPNPTQGVLHYRANSTSAVSLKIYNSLGELVNDKNLEGGIPEYTFQLTGLAPGVYVVHAQSDGKTTYHHVVVEK